jgi:hypothetical protein
MARSREKDAPADDLFSRRLLSYFDGAAGTRQALPHSFWRHSARAPDAASAAGVHGTAGL